MRPSSPGGARRRGAVRVSFRLVAVYILAVSVLTWWPAIYPGICAPIVPAVARLMDADNRIDAVEPTGDRIRLKATSLALKGFATTTGQLLPPLHYEGEHAAGAINTYLAIFLALYFACPMPPRWRWIGLGPALLLLVVASAAEIAAVAFYLGAEVFPQAFEQVRPLVASTPGNMAYGESLQHGFDRMARFKAFFTSGGRQFLPLVIVALIALPLFCRRLAAGRPLRVS